MTFDTPTLGFGQVRSGGVVTRILNITNESDVNTAFQVSIKHFVVIPSATETRECKRFLLVLQVPSTGNVDKVY